MIIRVVQSKGRKDRHVMLPAEVLDLLRQWWKARPTDAGVAPEQRWLFPGRDAHRPLTTRQFGRLFKEAARAQEWPACSCRDVVAIRLRSACRI
jgi:integrase